MLMRRLRMDHTGLNSSLFLMGKGIMVIVITVGLKKMLSMLYLSVLYTRRKDGGSGREWTLMGILATEGGGDN